jgi:hypothetical protein
MDHLLAWAHSPNSQGWDGDMIGYLASSMVLATFCMKSMRPLRLLAIVSNMTFISYAIITDMRPILILHSILLPVNAVRLAQIELDRLRQKRRLGRRCIHAMVGE